jgi:hypothetical protein
MDAIDRRRRPRPRVAAIAMLTVEERFLGSYLVENLSTGGVLLIGDLRLQPGAFVKVQIHIGGRPQAELSAEVVRREMRGKNTCYALRFIAVPPQVETVLAGVIAAQLRPQPRPRTARHVAGSPEK